MAYETLTVGKSSIRSDVWSYGVLLWEIMTLGETPYSDLQGGREIVSFLDSGQRLGKPNGCPQVFYAVMFDCWLQNTRLRPEFTLLDQQLAGMKASFDSTGSIETTPAVPGRASATPYWQKGALSREEAEEILDTWGGEVGTFLIRESGAAFVISRVGRSDAAGGSQHSVTMIIHRKIEYKAGMYQMQSTRTKAPAFKTLPELVSHYQNNLFSDNTQLVATQPQSGGGDASSIATTDGSSQAKNRYVNVRTGSAGAGADQTGADGAQPRAYVNLQQSPEKRSYVNVQEAR